MIRNIVLLGAIAVTIIVIACSARTETNTAAYEDATTDEFATLIGRDDVILLDVRSEGEYDEVHIDGAVLIDYKKPDFESKARAALDKEKTIAIYCHQGRRSAAAATLLARDGYRLVNLKGGIVRWANEGRSVVRK